MMDYEGEAPVGGRTYDPHCVDPSEAGALAATLWELPLAAQHYHPHVAQVRTDVCVHESFVHAHWARLYSAAYVHGCLYPIGDRTVQHYHPHEVQPSARAFCVVVLWRRKGNTARPSKSGLVRAGLCSSGCLKSLGEGV